MNGEFFGFDLIYGIIIIDFKIDFDFLCFQSIKVELCLLSLEIKKKFPLLTGQFI